MYFILVMRVDEVKMRVVVLVLLIIFFMVFFMLQEMWEVVGFRLKVLLIGVCFKICILLSLDGGVEDVDILQLMEVIEEVIVVFYWKEEIL